VTVTVTVFCNDDECFIKLMMYVLVTGKGH